MNKKSSDFLTNLLYLVNEPEVAVGTVKLFSILLIVGLVAITFGLAALIFVPASSVWMYIITVPLFGFILNYTLKLRHDLVYTIDYMRMMYYIAKWFFENEEHLSSFTQDLPDEYYADILNIIQELRSKNAN